MEYKEIDGEMVRILTDEEIERMVMLLLIEREVKKELDLFRSKDLDSQPAECVKEPASKRRRSKAVR